MAPKNTVNQIEVTKLVFSYLVIMATAKRLTTYEEIAKAHYLPDHGRVLGAILSPILEEILQFGKKRGWPPLTSIVVRKSGADEGLPGTGFWKSMSFDEQVYTREMKRTLTSMFHAQVFDYFDIPPAMKTK